MVAAENTDEDIDYVFTAADFGFSDANDSPANSLLAVKITTAPAAGTLSNNGVTVNSGNSVTVSDINGGKLKFSPAANGNGSAYSSFTFGVQDDGGVANSGVDLDQSANTITISVNPIADTLSVANATTNEDTQSAAIAVSKNAADGAELTHFKVTAISNGTLFMNDGTTQISAGDFVLFSAATANVKFTPAANLNSPGNNFGFTVQGSVNNTDAGLSGSPVASTITVNPLNDQPLANAQSLTTNEETALAITLTGSDDDAEQAQAFSYAIATDPAHGTISGLNSGTGALTYTPDAGYNGADSFTFTVTDDATAGGAARTSAGATVSITVAAVNDKPTFSASDPLAVAQNAGSQTIVSWAVFAPGAMEEAGQVALAYTTSNVSNTSLFTAGGQPGVAKNGTLSYTAAANAHGTSTFDVVVQDSGGVARGGVDTSDVQTFTITVEAPAATSTRTATAVPATQTPTQTATRTATATSTASRTATLTTTATRTATLTATLTATRTTVPAATATTTNVAGATSTRTNTPGTATATNTNVAAATATRTNTAGTATVTNTTVASATATGTPTSTVTGTPVQGATATHTSVADATATSTATATASRTAVAGATVTNTMVAGATATNTATSTVTGTPVEGATATNTTVAAATSTSTVTMTASRTTIAGATATSTTVAVATATGTATSTVTGTPVQGATATNTTIAGATETSTITRTPVKGATATNTTVIDTTSTSTATQTQVPGATVTNTAEASATATRTATSTASRTTVPGATATNTTVAAATATANATVTATATRGQVFIDVPPSHTFYDYIMRLYEHGVISGYSDDTFRPHKPITRAQIAKLVSLAAGFDEDPGEQIYSDVPPEHPFYAYINRLTNRGIVSGYPCPQLLSVQEECSPENPALFHPEANATRGQLAKIVSNAAGYDEEVSGQYYADVPATGEGSLFYKWIMRLTNRGVVSGYVCDTAGRPCDEENRPYFNWSADVTRGQAAKIVANTFYP